MHIYRDSGSRGGNKTTNSAEASTSPRNESILAHMDHKSEIVPLDGDGIVLSVLAVPSWMTPSDFLAFVAPAAQGMSHIRMIRYGQHIFYSALAYAVLKEILLQTGQLSSSSSDKQRTPPSSLKPTMADRSTRWRLATSLYILVGC